MGIDSAPTPPDIDTSDSSKEVVITGHPTIGAYASSLQDTPQNVTVIPQDAPRSSEPHIPPLWTR